jgi:hypothetical protein
MSELPGKYPRGLPHRPPPEEGDTQDARNNRPRAESRLSTQDLAALEARMRMRLLLVILGSLAVLVVMVLVGIFYVNQAVHRASTMASVGIQDSSRQENAVPPSVQESKRPEPPPQPVAVPATRQDRTAEVLGGLTAAHLHQTYLNIGLLADAAENDVYSAEEGRRFLETILSLINSVDQQLEQVSPAMLSAAEQKKLAQARQVAGLLRTEAKLLQAYWDTPDADKEKKKEKEAAFHKVRKSAWEGIKELTGIAD